jgi:hypothetical protein
MIKAPTSFSGNQKLTFVLKATYRLGTFFQLLTAIDKLYMTISLTQCRCYVVLRGSIFCEDQHLLVAISSKY